MCVLVFVVCACVCQVKDVVGGLGVREHFITYRAEVQVRTQLHHINTLKHNTIVHHTVITRHT